MKVSVGVMNEGECGTNIHVAASDVHFEWID